MAGCDAALIATPSSELREVLGRMRASGFEQPVIWACKGFERASGKLPHQVAAEVLGKRAACGALSGPSFALEVAQGRPTALTLAAGDAGVARRSAREPHQPTPRGYFSPAPAGLEISRARENGIANRRGSSE